MLLQLLLGPSILFATQVSPADALKVSNIDWYEYAKEGYLLHQEVQRHSTLGDVSLYDLGDDIYSMTIPPRLAVPMTGLLRTIMGEPPINATSVYEMFGYEPPKFDDRKDAARYDERGTFHAVLNVRQGFFVATEWKQGALPGIKWPPSQIAWYLWQRALQRAELKKDPDGCDDSLDYSRLKWFTFQNVRDPVTLELVRRAAGSSFDHNSTQMRLNWTSANIDPENAFWPLIASPTFRQLMNMLRWHKQATGYKNVKQIWVERHPSKTFSGKIYAWNYYMGSKLAWPSSLSSNSS